MNRRCILQFAIGVGVASGARPILAQQAPVASIRRVGVLAPSTRANEEVTLKPFFDEMRRLGWIEGRPSPTTATTPMIAIRIWPDSQPSWWRASRI